MDFAQENIPLVVLVFGGFIGVLMLIICLVKFCCQIGERSVRYKQMAGYYRNRKAPCLHVTCAQHRQIYGYNRCWLTATSRTRSDLNNSGINNNIYFINIPLTTIHNTDNEVLSTLNSSNASHVSALPPTYEDVLADWNTQTYRNTSNEVQTGNDNHAGGICNGGWGSGGGGDASWGGGDSSLVGCDSGGGGSGDSGGGGGGDSGGGGGVD